jgi:hypothetical protein
MTKSFVCELPTRIIFSMINEESIMDVGDNGMLSESCDRRKEGHHRRRKKYRKMSFVELNIEYKQLIIGKFHEGELFATLSVSKACCIKGKSFELAHG